MLIPLPTGACRTAICAAIAAAKEGIEGDRAKLREHSYSQLHEGAVHNGLKPSKADLQRMEDMAANDTAHMMESHPAQEVVQHLEKLIRMIDYTDEKEVIVDAAEFGLIEKHLPPRE